MRHDLSDEDIQRLADEAERGYDLTNWTRRKVRKTVDDRIAEIRLHAEEAAAKRRWWRVPEEAFYAEDIPYLLERIKILEEAVGHCEAWTRDWKEQSNQVRVVTLQLVYEKATKALAAIEEIDAHSM